MPRSRSTLHRRGRELLLTPYPPHPPVSTGCAVWVPFGSRLLQGVVFNLTDHSPVETTRAIAQVIDSRPLLRPYQIELARWIAEYYLCSYFDASSLMLPPGFERRILTFVQCLPDAPEEIVEALTPMQEKVFHLLHEKGRVDMRRLREKVPQKQLEAAINQLIRKGVVSKTVELERPRVKAKMVPYIRLSLDIHQTQAEIAALGKRKVSKQAELLKVLMAESDAIPLSTATRKSGASSTAARSLEKKGLVAIEQVRVVRDPLAHRNFTVTPPPKLTPDQETAWSKIQERLRTTDNRFGVFLLHGVTGSGKTEIYLRALEETIARGKKAIVLVPEISLTPQTISRFASRFPGRVAVLHSRLSPGEQFDEWQRIRDGECDVVIGSRGAVFAPQPDLGLIVIDEEHEWTYKQHDKSPLYHARDAALKLAELTGAVVILGSATPDLASCHRAKTGRYHLLELPARVGEGPDGAYPRLPQVEVVDLRRELKQGNRSIFSRLLARGIGEALSAGEQVILFLNRRGTASFVQCRNCGHVMRCRRCDLTLTYHAPENYLTCHQCNYSILPPTSCPECWSRRIKFLGIGTQKVEEETARAFPQARLLRWDRDVTRGKHSHEQILQRFQSHDADILIGTQMIAKGLDIPLVTLVGVINADVGLYLPDFRAGERTFQLLSQVAGRAGRGRRGGRVIIQTYTPEHYAIVAAGKQDFSAFYEQEIAFRHEHGNPPFNRLVSLIYAHTNPERCQQEAERMMLLLRQERDSQGLAGTTLIGPSPAHTQQIRGRYRWQVIIRGSDPMSIISKVPIPQGWTVDIDPVGLA
ncbi:primosomal protein N' [Dehalococcoidia bacterium]|nr:primosomal protein N' [Dehalococcoidia bacterium]